MKYVDFLMSRKSWIKSSLKLTITI